MLARTPATNQLFNISTNNLTTPNSGKVGTSKKAGGWGSGKVGSPADCVHEFPSTPCYKDVLEKLIKHDNAVIRIYYHNKEAMAKQISNLVKVIGADSLILMTRGRERKIQFLQASQARDEVFCKTMVGKER